MARFIIRKINKKSKSDFTLFSRRIIKSKILLDVCFISSYSRYIFYSIITFITYRNKALTEFNRLYKLLLYNQFSTHSNITQKLRIIVYL